jgi:hypothetical protein
MERVRIITPLTRVVRSGSMGKQKGSGFERKICVALSLWLSCGQRKDLLWRSAMSGGRATVSRGTVRQAGDITAVAPEGHDLIDHCFIECKHYRDLGLSKLLLGKGILASFWLVARREAAVYRRAPIVIAKQNMFSTLLLTEPRGQFYIAASSVSLPFALVPIDGPPTYVYQLDKILALPYPRG